MAVTDLALLDDELNTPHPRYMGTVHASTTILSKDGAAGDVTTVIQVYHRPTMDQIASAYGISLSLNGFDPDDNYRVITRRLDLVQHPVIFDGQIFS